MKVHLELGLRFYWGTDCFVAWPSCEGSPWMGFDILLCLWLVSGLTELWRSLPGMGFEIFISSEWLVARLGCQEPPGIGGWDFIEVLAGSWANWVLKVQLEWGLRFYCGTDWLVARFSCGGPSGMGFEILLRYWLVSSLTEV